MEYNHKQVIASLTVSDKKAKNAFKKAYQKDTVAQQLLEKITIRYENHDQTGDYSGERIGLCITVAATGSLQLIS